MDHHPYTWFYALRSSLGFLEPVPEHTLASLFVTFLLIGVALLVRGTMQRPEDALVPGERPSLPLLTQYYVEGISNLAENVIGHDSARYVPLLGTFFIFILACNLIGLVPGFSSATSNFNITLALGVVAFVSYHVYGFREHGVSYGRQFLGPLLWLAPLMLVVEIFSHAFRPISLAIRLFANMFADHQVLEQFTALTYVVVPVAFYMLGAFVSVIQAFVFTMLTAIYISLAISHEH